MTEILLIWEALRWWSVIKIMKSKILQIRKKFEIWMFGSGDFFYKLTKKLTKPKNFRASRLGLGNFY